MGCGSTRSGTLTGRGFRSENITGTLPGMGGCGCGCSATAEKIAGLMPGAGLSRRTMAHQASGVLPGVLFPSSAASLRDGRLNSMGLLAGMEGSSLAEARSSWRCSRSYASPTASLLGQTRRSGDEPSAFSFSRTAAGLRSAAYGSDRRGRIAVTEDASPWEAQNAERTNSEIAEMGDTIWEDIKAITLASCTILEPPDRSEWGACGHKMEGDSDPCSYYACDVAEDLPDCAELAESDQPISIDDRRDEVTACQAQLADILRAAWAVLRQNTDLVSWATCWTFGPYNGNCVLSTIRRGWDGEDVQIRVDPDPPSRFEGAAAATDDFEFLWIDRRWIWIFPSDDYWQTAIALWCCEQNPEMACVAIDVACILYHELLHFCNLVGEDPTPDTTCYQAYAADAAFRWAMYRRYKTLEDDWFYKDGVHGYRQPCCDVLVSETEFASRQPYTLGHGCSASEVDCEWKTCGSKPCS